MDISILLSLQAFRESMGGFLTGFLAKMTFLTELNSVIVIMAILYWSISKELGVYLFMGWGGNRLANGFLKVTACAYRPWIRDPRILPYGDAITTATGYSFPSGHTMNGATVFGGLSLRRELPGTLRVVLGICVALVAFSRMFLGVHTPQDVIVGAVIGLLVMGLTLRIMGWVASNPEKDWIVLCAGIVLGTAIALYAAFKPYPADFDAEGKLIVDGAKMANDTFKGVGYSLAVLIGWILERRIVGFSTEIPVAQRLSRAFLGLISYYAVSLMLVPLIKAWIPGAAGTMLSCFLQVFYVMFLFPWCFHLAERSTRSQHQPD
ncbi:MAG: phosphatase PAP2 family protein [Clostridia bacterium]|nr:phosphatase PAP2 family protein [Clostridia bacterium]